MAISPVTPDPARHAAARVVSLVAATGDEPRHATPLRLVRLLVLETAALRGIPLRDWPAPAADERPDLREAARDLARMHADRPVEWIGAMHEQVLAAEAPPRDRAARGVRKRAGAFYTPPALVAHLLDAALDPVIDERRGRIADPVSAITSIRLLDPSCGGGNFLLAAARRLADHLVRHSSLTRTQAMSLVVMSCIHGVDIDPAAVEACIGSLMIEAASPSLSRTSVAARIRYGDALTGTLAGTDLPSVTLPASPPRSRRDAWHDAVPGREADQAADDAILHWPRAFPHVFPEGDAAAGFDVVVGNPPFLNQLEKATMLTRARDALIRAVSDGVGGSYTDLSATFLWRSVQLAAPGGRVAMVQPQSLLASRDAGPVRTAIASRACLESIWIADEHAFEGASVYTCAPVLHVGGVRRETIARTRGITFEPLTPFRVGAEEWAQRQTWSPIAAAAFGVPEVPSLAGPVIGEIAAATADFRDQYYGLEGFLVEDDHAPGATEASHPRLVTTGLIDVARMRWGERPVRMLRRAWRAPRVDRGRMEREGTLGPWLERRLVPKVLLATQTRILEAWVDEAGEVVPCIPLLTVTPKGGVDLWTLAAAVASPVACAVAMQRHAGTALTIDAIKLSAAQVLRLPLPTCPGRWREAATLFKAASLASSDVDRREALRGFGREMCDAYGLEPALRDLVAAWWESRLEGSMGATRRARGPRA